MGPIIKGKYGNRVMESEVKALFGLQPKQKWPNAGMGSQTINGILCWVNALPQKQEGRRRRFALRAMCMCPVCKKILPIGRLHQHAPVHPG